MSFNLDTAPVGFGIGKVISTQKAIFNFWVEPQVSVVDEGAGWPEWQIFRALNTQLKGSEAENSYDKGDPA